MLDDSLMLITLTAVNSFLILVTTIIGVVVAIRSSRKVDVNTKDIKENTMETMKIAVSVDGRLSQLIEAKETVAHHAGVAEGAENRKEGN